MYIELKERNGSATNDDSFYDGQSNSRPGRNWRRNRRIFPTTGYRSRTLSTPHRGGGGGSLPGRGQNRGSSPITPHRGRSRLSHWRGNYQRLPTVEEVPLFGTDKEDSSEAKCAELTLNPNRFRGDDNRPVPSAPEQSDTFIGTLQNTSLPHAETGHTYDQQTALCEPTVLHQAHQQYEADIKSRKKPSTFLIRSRESDISEGGDVRARVPTVAPYDVGDDTRRMNNLGAPQNGGYSANYIATGASLQHFGEQEAVGQLVGYYCRPQHPVCKEEEDTGEALELQDIGTNARQQDHGDIAHSAGNLIIGHNGMNVLYRPTTDINNGKVWTQQQHHQPQQQGGESKAMNGVEIFNNTNNGLHEVYTQNNVRESMESSASVARISHRAVTQLYDSFTSENSLTNVSIGGWVTPAVPNNGLPNCKNMPFALPPVAYRGGAPGDGETPVTRLSLEDNNALQGGEPGGTCGHRNVVNNSRPPSSEQVRNAWQEESHILSLRQRITEFLNRLPSFTGNMMSTSDTQLLHYPSRPRSRNSIYPYYDEDLTAPAEPLSTQTTTFFTLQADAVPVTRQSRLMRLPSRPNHRHDSTGSNYSRSSLVGPMHQSMTPSQYERQQSRKWCRRMVFLLLVACSLLAIVCLGYLLYLLASKAESSKQALDSGKTVIIKNEVEITVRITNVEYVPDMRSNTSTVYLAFTRNFCAKVSEGIEAQQKREDTVYCQVISLSPGSVIVDFKVSAGNLGNSLDEKLIGSIFNDTEGNCQDDQCYIIDPQSIAVLKRYSTGTVAVAGISSTPWSSSMPPTALTTPYTNSTQFPVSTMMTIFINTGNSNVGNQNTVGPASQVSTISSMGITSSPASTMDSPMGDGNLLFTKKPPILWKSSASIKPSVPTTPISTESTADTASRASLTTPLWTTPRTNERPLSVHPTQVTVTSSSANSNSAMNSVTAPTISAAVSSGPRLTTPIWTTPRIPTSSQSSAISSSTIPSTASSLPTSNTQRSSLISGSSVSNTQRSTLSSGASVTPTVNAVSPTKGPPSKSSLSTSPTQGPSSASTLSNSPTKGPSSPSTLSNSPTKGPSSPSTLSNSPTKGPPSPSTLSNSPTKGPSSASTLSNSPTKGPSSASSLSTSQTKGPSLASTLSNSQTKGPSLASTLSNSPTKGPSLASSSSTSPRKGPSSASSLSSTPYPRNSQEPDVGSIRTIKTSIATTDPMNSATSPLPTSPSGSNLPSRPSKATVRTTGGPGGSSSSRETQSSTNKRLTTRRWTGFTTTQSSAASGELRNNTNGPTQDRANGTATTPRPGSNTNGPNIAFRSSQRPSMPGSVTARSSATARTTRRSTVLFSSTQKPPTGSAVTAKPNPGSTAKTSPYSRRPTDWLRPSVGPSAMTRASTEGLQRTFRTVRFTKSSTKPASATTERPLSRSSSDVAVLTTRRFTTARPNSNGVQGDVPAESPTDRTVFPTIQQSSRGTVGQTNAGHQTRSTRATPQTIRYSSNPHPQTTNSTVSSPSTRLTSQRQTRPVVRSSTIRQSITTVKPPATTSILTTIARRSTTVRLQPGRSEPNLRTTARPNRASTPMKYWRIYKYPARPLVP